MRGGIVSRFKRGGRGWRPLDFGFNGCNDHFPSPLSEIFFSVYKTDFCDILLA